MAVVSEILTKFKFKGNINSLKDFNKESKKGISNSKKFAAATIALGVAHTRAGRNARKAGEDWDNFLAVTNTSSKKFNEFAEVAIQKSGANIDQIKAGIRSINSLIQQSYLTGNKSDFFSALEINPLNPEGKPKKPMVVVQEIQERFSSNQGMMRDWEKPTKAQWLASNTQFPPIMIDAFLNPPTPYEDDTHSEADKEREKNRAANKAKNAADFSKEVKDKKKGASFAFVDEWMDKVRKWWNDTLGIGSDAAGWSLGVAISWVLYKLLGKHLNILFGGFNNARTGGKHIFESTKAAWKDVKSVKELQKENPGITEFEAAQMVQAASRRSSLSNQIESLRAQGNEGGANILERQLVELHRLNSEIIGATTAADKTTAIMNLQKNLGELNLIPKKVEWDFKKIGWKIGQAIGAYFSISWFADSDAAVDDSRPTSLFNPPLPPEDFGTYEDNDNPLGTGDKNNKTISFFPTPEGLGTGNSDVSIGNNVPASLFNPSGSPTQTITIYQDIDINADTSEVGENIKNQTIQGVNDAIKDLQDHNLGGGL